MFAFGNILISFLIGGFRLILRKAKSSVPSLWKVWNYLTSLGLLLFAGNLILLLLAAMNQTTQLFNLGVIWSCRSGTVLSRMCGLSAL
ncbi:hypothetical protein HGP05_09015 [Streptococcus sanguinis]|uniref:Uncharacterized protein n=1 Tax=Streptococcus sanguinis TaxID=1305 RepID=A0A7Y0VBI8_STRSA|nr:hypothetical protein [Streptococcus sanguinis]